MSGCRISRVRYRDGREIHILKNKIQDTRFIRTLVWILDRARAGDVRSFAMVFRVEKADGSMAWVESSDILPDEDGGDLSMILGGIERMKLNLIERHKGGAEYFTPSL